MNELNDLYNSADVRNVRIDNFRLDGCESLSLCDGDLCFIAIDPLLNCTSAEEKVILAHELGHCITGSFYNRYSVVDDRKRSERRADIFAYNLLINRDELKKQLKSGVQTVWELADYFNVTEPFMNEAVEYYQNIGIV